MFKHLRLGLLLAMLSVFVSTLVMAHDYGPPSKPKTSKEKVFSKEAVSQVILSAYNAMITEAAVNKGTNSLAILVKETRIQVIYPTYPKAISDKSRYKENLELNAILIKEKSRLCSQAYIS